MTLKEVAKILAMVSARYPTAKLFEQDDALTVKAWHITLGDVSYSAVHKAMIFWFKTEKWAPDPSELREAVFDLIESCRTSEERLALEPGWQPTVDRRSRQQLGRTTESAKPLRPPKE